MGKTGWWIGGIFTPIGLLFSGLGLWLYLNDQDLAAKGVRASGTVIQIVSYRDSDGETMYRPVVEFTDTAGSRREFSSDVSSSTSEFQRGEAVDVIYDPVAPENAIIDSFMERFFLPLIFGGLGSIFALVGAGILFTTIRRRQIVAALKERGLRINAEFVGCQLDTSIKINGRSPFRVFAQATHPMTGKLASFESEPIWLDLTGELERQQVPVLIDPTKPKRHYVDLSEWVHEREHA